MLPGSPPPDDPIHAGLKASFSDASGQAPPGDPIHAGLKASFSIASDDYAALRDFVAGNDVAKGAAKPVVVAAAATETTKTKKPQAEAVDTGPATYVGSQACVRCHRDLFGPFEQTLMGQIFLHHPRDAQEKEGCESCHGPGSKHVNTNKPEDIISFAKDSPLPVAERNAVCLTCHERGERTYWDGSTHDTRGLACTSCHQIMQKVSVKFQLAEEHRTGDVLPVPQGHSRQDGELVAHAGAEWLDVVLLLPQPPRQRDG